MADAKKVFSFEIDGIEKSIEDFNSLSDSIDVLEKRFEEADKAIEAADNSIESFGKDADLKGAANDLSIINSNVTELGDNILDTSNDLDNLADNALEVAEGIDVVADALDNAEGALDDFTAEDKLAALTEIGQAPVQALEGLGNGLASLGDDSEVIEELKGRFEGLGGVLGNVQGLTQALSGENRKAAASLLRSFKALSIGAKLFGSTTRAAIASTGIGLLVVAIAAIVTNFDEAKAAAIAFGERAKKALDTFAPALSSLIDRTTAFAERVGGFRQLFAGALESAKVFFTSIGESFAALLKGDIGRIREIFKDFGKESSEAFNEGVKAANEAIAEERIREQLAQEIKVNERLIKEREAAGRDTFNLQRANLRRRIKLAEEGSEELLDLQSELRQLQLSKNKEFNDAIIEQDKQRLEEQKALQEEEAADDIAFFQELLDKEAELEERNNTAKFERQQLFREQELEALEEQEQQTRDIIAEAAEIRLEILQAEKDRRLEQEELTQEELLLLEDEFNIAALDVEAQRDEAFLQLKQELSDKRQAQIDQAAEADRVAKAEEIAREKNLVTALANLDNERLQNAKAVTAFIGELAKEGSAIKKAAFAVDKVLAVAEILINLQRELAAIAASNAGLGPAAPAVVAALQLQAGIRAGLGIAAVGATVLKFKKGGLLRGPSHSRGGIRGTGSFSNVEVEGGEFIMNKVATQRNLPKLKAMNSLQYQEGGLLPDFEAINNALLPEDNFNEILIEEIRAINGAPVVVSVEEINTVQDRVVDIREGATI